MRLKELAAWSSTLDDRFHASAVCRSPATRTPNTYLVSTLNIEASKRGIVSYGGGAPPVRPPRMGRGRRLQRAHSRAARGATRSAKCVSDAGAARWSNAQPSARPPTPVRSRSPTGNIVNASDPRELAAAAPSSAPGRQRGSCNCRALPRAGAEERLSTPSHGSGRVQSLLMTSDALVAARVRAASGHCRRTLEGGWLCDETCAPI